VTGPATGTDPTVWRLDRGPLQARILPQQGGRLAVLRFRGVDAIVPPGRVPGFWGDTFWPSPQSLFDWPPPATLDGAPYEVLGAGPDRIALRSRPDARLGLQVEKLCVVGDDAVGFTFTLGNVGRQPRGVAPWQVTRAPRAGLLVWQPGQRFDDDDRVVKHVEDPGCWYWHDRLPDFAGHEQIHGHAAIRVPDVTTTSKFFTDARGWAAHVHSGLVVLRIFPDIEPDQMAPRQAELELFFGLERDYIEVENQGPYRALEPGEALTYHVEWRIASLPPGIPADRLTPELVDLIEQMRRRPALLR
jgi:hypothetical protein